MLQYGGVAGIMNHLQCACLSTDHPSPLLDNIRVMVIVWTLRGNIITTALCWIV